MAGLDAGHLQMEQEGFAVDAILDDDRVHHPGVLGVLAYRGELEIPGEIGEAAGQDGGVFLAAAENVLVAGELADAERRLHLGRPVAVADVDERKAAGHHLLEDVCVLGIVVIDRQVDVVAPVVHQALHQRRQAVVVGGGEAADAGHDQVRHIAGEAGHVAPRPGGPTFVMHEHRFARVLDHAQVVGLCEGHDRVHLTRLAKEVHRHHGARPPGEMLRQLRRVDADVVWLDVDEDGLEAVLQDDIGAGHEGHRRDQHLVARFPLVLLLERVHRHLQGAGPAVAEDGVPPIVQPGEFLFEALAVLAV